MIMTIKKLSPDKVRITLTQEELAAYEIDWDAVGPEDEPTRELLLQLLDCAWQSAGFCPDEGQVYIEALPTDSGCVIILSKAHSTDTLDVHVEMTPEMFTDNVGEIERRQKQLVDGLRAMLGLAAKVTLVAPKSIVRSEGKAVRVIDNRKI